MRDEGHVEEMYGQPTETTLHWPANPHTLLYQRMADALLLAGVVMGALALLQEHPRFLVGSAVSVLLAWLAQRWEQRLVKQFTAERDRICRMLGCVVIGQAEHASGIPYMKTYLRSSQPVILGLSDTHLTLYLDDPLRVYVTIPLRDVVHVFTGPPAEADAVWDEDNLDIDLPAPEGTLSVIARLGSTKTYRLVFHKFEQGLSARDWRDQIEALLAAQAR